ncbi:MAG: PaaI family thioesterase [Ardenticatenales bacterium]|nr:PaaI family thioesterase [Ardenticatenales bacterium]
MLAAGQDLSGLAYIRQIRDGLLPAPPIAALMGMQFDEVEEGRVVMSVMPAEYHYNPLGTVHGGLAATICDSAMACAVHTMLPAGKAYTTLELHINYIRPITQETGQLRCIGSVIHVGRRMATAEARLIDAGDKLYCHSTTTCIVL